MKDIYELLNELNVDSSDIKEIEVSEIERERGKKKLINSLKSNKSNKKKIAVAVASLAIISLVSVTVAKPTWATNIPIIGELVQKSLIDVNKQYGDYMSTVGQTKSQDGIDVTFENAVADKNMFIFSFIVKNNNDPIEDPQTLFMPMSLNINGKDINMSGSSECEVVDKNTVRYLQTVDWEKTELPKYLNVKIDIPSMFDKSGDWGVKFSINTKDIEKNTYVEKLNKKFTADNIDFGLDEISISPLSTNIKYYAKSDDYLSMFFLVLDQDNNEVKFAGGTSKDKDCDGGEKGKIKFNMNYTNNGNVRSLKLIPRYKNKDYKEEKVESKKINLNNFSPFEVKLTDNMSINIDDCIIDNGNLIVKYNYKYLGKTMEQQEGGINDFDIKANGISLAETDDDLAKKYKTKDEKIQMYKIGDTKDIEMEFYDGAAKELRENEAFTVIKR